MHEITLITTIAFSLTAALVFGLLAKRVGLSPIVGYLIAGIAVGPFTPGFVGDVHLAKQLAEIGVILLMFGVGLHFHWDELMSVRSIAIPGALGQSAASTLCGLVLAIAIGWTWNSGVVFGIAISVASTVVLLRALSDHGVSETAEGKIAIGWLVVEDIITVLVLVLLPALAFDAGSTAGQVLASAGIAIAKLLGLAVVVGVLGVRFVPWLLLRVARLRSRELFTLTVLVVAMAVATVGYLAFGASMALGAFLAGMVVGQSKLSHQAAADALPMRDAFAVLFFVSIGMLFDWREVVREPGLVIGLVAIIVIVKPLIALLIVIGLRHSLKTALTVAAGLAQIGEFSFIVADAAKGLRILPEAGHHALVGAAMISIALNPWIFQRLLGLEGWIQRQPRLSGWVNRRVAVRGNQENRIEAVRPAEPSRPRAIVVGYGPVGMSVARRAQDLGLDPLVIDLNIDTVLALHAEKRAALYGDATHPQILIEAGLKQAACIIVTLPDIAVAIGVITSARAINRSVRILARSRYSNQGEALEQAGADAVCNDEAESATALSVMLRAHVNDLQAAGQQMAAK